MRLLRIVTVIVCLPAFCQTLPAQQTGSATAVGFPTGGHFTGSEIESVQVNNGNLHVRIPLWSLSGRGITPTAAFIYDSKGWYPFINCGLYTCAYTVAPEQGNTMQMSINASSASAITNQFIGKQHCENDGVTNYTLRSNYIEREPEGTKHHMIPDPVTTNTTAQQNCWPTINATLYADDGSGWVNGTSKTGGIPGVSDTNGNFVGTTDTMGRPFNPTSGSYYDSNGVLRNISVTTQSVTISTHLCFPSPDPGSGDTCGEYSSTWTVPHIITLPNGLSYTINYVQNDEGEISSITFPTGATVSYQYSNPPTYDFGGKQVTQRTVTVGSQVSVWTYSYSNTGVTTVIDPLNNKTIYTCNEFGAGLTCNIAKEQYYDSSGNIIKTVDIGYNGLIVGAMLPVSRTTTWASTNQVSKVEADYETMTVNMFPDGAWGPVSAPVTWGNLAEKREYDWGAGASGSLLRRTTYAYLHTDTTVNPNSNRALYLAANIADRPTSEVVKDGSGNIIAQTKY